MNDSSPLSPEVSPLEPLPQRERYPFWGYQDLVILLGLTLPVLAVSALIVTAVSQLLPAQKSSPAVGVLGAQFLAYILWFLCLWALIRFRYHKPFWFSLAWVTPRRSLLLYAVCGPLLALAVGFAGALLQTPEIEMPMMDLLRDRLSITLVGIFAVTLGPLAEELVFRGFVLPLLTRSFGPAIAVLLTSGVFALLHGPQYAWSWRHVLLVGLASVTFCLVRLRSGSTLSATAMHATYNLTFFIAYLAQGDFPV